MKKASLLFPLALLSLTVNCLFFTGSFAQSKEWESDVIYSEGQVPYYELPNPLHNIDGTKITTAEEWLNTRRPQIMGLFATTLYGQVPVPELPIQQQFEVIAVDTSFFEGRCTRKQIEATFSNARGRIKMHIALFVPNGIDQPVPLLLRMGFGDVTADNMDLNNIQAYGRLKNGTPLVDLLDQGFGLACIKGGEIVKDEVGFSRSIQQLFYKGKQSMPRATEWGVLAAIAWQFSRTMDYLETEKAIDASKVAILGFSKLGKSTLWAGALDTRFAMVFSQNSGCAGAALWRRNFGENLKYMSRFPHWLCDNAQKFIGREEDLPVDQHMLLACIAPRPVYIVSGINDLWADNRGEYLSAHYATPVYELFGLQGQSSPERPRLNEASDNRALAYHIRSGAHGYHQYDWDQYIKFMAFHFKGRKKDN